jgi:ribosomal protein S18 acetylase RimI-like enzyme
MNITFLSNIELLPAFQGQGIGTHLITALIAEAQQFVATRGVTVNSPPSGI